MASVETQTLDSNHKLSCDYTSYVLFFNLTFVDSFREDRIDRLRKGNIKKKNSTESENVEKNNLSLY